ncbi:MAG: DUF1638 domain-containing protein [Anaerolineae bacterium]
MRDQETKRQNLLAPVSRHVLACATVMEEMLPLLPADVSYQVLDFGLHINPANLKLALQEAIDEAAHIADTVILGYGLCSMAVIGLRANGCTLVVPRVDDCIAIFLGSGHAYKQQSRAEPGTYYLTKGWIEVCDTPFDEYDRLVGKYGPEKAEWLIRQMIKNYTRLALIDTGRDGLEHYRDHVRALAERWDLRFEEIPGSNALVRQMLFGPWDEGFVVVPPGESIRYEHFFPGAAAHNPQEKEETKA